LIYATAIGTDIGGNGTPIGASANVVALAAADRAGIPIRWGTYLRRAFPVMLASLAASNLVWLVVH
jgi:Na+/H+ antiporter NhaD/arsenite permease-like protein